MGSEKFCLRWNDFESNISTAFRERVMTRTFFDVTLACEDEQMQAHKVILSACSPFFRNILHRNSHQHPLLYLKGVKFTDLQSVLNFMYHGEVNVAQEELNSFLAVAEDLRVKGLTQNHNQVTEKRTEKKDLPSSYPPPPPIKTPSRFYDREPVIVPEHKRSRPVPPPSTSSSRIPAPSEDEIQEVVSVKTEPRDHSASVVSEHRGGGAVDLYEEHPQGAAQGSRALAPVDDQGYHESYEEYEYGGDQQGYEMTMGEMGVEGNKDFFPVESGYQCCTCGKICAYKNTIKRHIIDQHTDKNSVLQCVFCLKMYKNKNSLDQHRYKEHREQVLAGI